jgi:hypothetical protein
MTEILRSVRSLLSSIPDGRREVLLKVRRDIDAARIVKEFYEDHTKGRITRDDIAARLDEISKEDPIKANLVEWGVFYEPKMRNEP